MRWLVVVCVLAACTQDRPADTGPPIMEKPERDRGMEICTKYVERVCRCGDKDICDLAKGMPQGLELHIELLDGQRGPLNAKERGLTEQSARKIVAACVEADGRLDPKTCPR
jgi:hypothetical protein